jgi:DNA-binding NtrC family response regulator
MRGPELARRLLHLRPGLKVLYVSGYIEHDQADGDFMRDASFLNKPFSRDMLVNQVGEALRKPVFMGAPASLRSYSGTPGTTLNSEAFPLIRS